MQTEMSAYQIARAISALVAGSSNPTETLSGLSTIASSLADAASRLNAPDAAEQVESAKWSLAFAAGEA